MGKVEQHPVTGDIEGAMWRREGVFEALRMLSDEVAQEEYNRDVPIANVAFDLGGRFAIDQLIKADAPRFSQGRLRLQQIKSNVFAGSDQNCGGGRADGAHAVRASRAPESRERRPFLFGSRIGLDMELVQLQGLRQSRSMGHDPQLVCQQQLQWRRDVHLALRRRLR